MKYKEYVLTGEEMQRYDANTITHFKIPGLVLMEQAALAACEEIVKRFPNPGTKVLILAGKGNNGGDALAIARLLYQKGYPVTVHIVSNRSFTREDFSESAGVQYDILQSMGVLEVPNLPTDSYDIVIDGIFGVGLNRTINGKIAETIQQINFSKGYKIALDIPSGIHAATGEVLGVAFKADVTITFAFFKRGLFLLPGAGYAGEVIKKEIGITSESFLENPPEMFALMGEGKAYVPKRSPWGHKGTFGKILLIAGSKQIAGAAILAGRACMMSGCGMLRICTHREQKTEILTSFPEAMVDVYSDAEEAKEVVRQGMAWADVVAIGPGLGCEKEADMLLKTVIEEVAKPIVMDADALNLLSLFENFELLKKVRSMEGRKPLILTPHPMELCRLLGCDRDTLREQGLALTQKLAEELHCVVVKKDARTIVCSEHQPFVINLKGNSGMATAGSGDVLTGIIAAMLALKLPDHEAAAVGVYLHALAGDKAAQTMNEYSMLAGDICNALSEVLK